jgi:hypothetical protein
MGTDAREPLDPGNDPRVDDALASIAQALTVPPDELTARRHRRAIARARQLQPVVLARRSAATGVAAAVLVGALAVGGALPGSVQDTVADLAGRVGLDLPRSTTDSEVPPPVPAGNDDEAREADTWLDDDPTGARGERGGSTTRDGDADAVPATESRRPAPADELAEDAGRSGPGTPSEADDRAPSDPPADAPGAGAPGSTPAPTPTPSEPPVSRPSTPPPAPDEGPPSGPGDAAPPRQDEGDRDDPREDGRATGMDEPGAASDHPA